MSSLLEKIHDMIWHERPKPSDGYSRDKVRQEQEEAERLTYGLAAETELLRRTAEEWRKHLTGSLS